ncbi:MAG TPA: trypsin-like peptidase domain-containing protein [Kofleriaceae bacterium]|nr:trypsin-like peptidase domain-containing protein [Kofleriaceae bacterium]
MALCAIVVCAMLGACRERVDTGAQGPGAGPAPALTSPAATRILYPSAPGSFVDLVASARHAVVAIRSGAPVKSGPAAMFPGTPETTADVALGTGFLVEAHGVFVLTNDHIAAASTDLHVVLPDHREAPARLVGRDVRLDLALLSIDLPRLAPLALGNSDDLQVGEWLVVLGNPFGDEVSASVGIVSATGRDAAGSLVPGRAMGFRTFLATDARVHRGNSGGPVIDTAGQVVGVAVATGDRPGEVSFAIPINRVKEVIDSLRDFGQVSRSWLGVLVKPVDAELAATTGLPKASGALITEVKAGSPAARAGLRAGDIVLSWGDREVDHRSLPWIVSQAPASRPVNVAVWRNRAQVQVPVVPEKMPE